MLYLPACIFCGQSHDTSKYYGSVQTLCKKCDNARRAAAGRLFFNFLLPEAHMPSLPSLGRFLLWPLAFGTLAACSATPDTSTWPKHITSGEAPRMQCDAKAAKFLEQQPYTEDTLARALAAAGADEARVLLNSQMMTKEFKRGRLNITVDDEQRTVLRVHCG